MWLHECSRTVELSFGTKWHQLILISTKDIYLWLKPKHNVKLHRRIIKAVQRSTYLLFIDIIWFDPKTRLTLALFIEVTVLSLELIQKCSRGPSCPWSYGSWIYNYICNQWLSPLMLEVRIPIRANCTTLWDKVWQWLARGWWFSAGPPVSSTNKTDRHASL